MIALVLFFLAAMHHSIRSAAIPETEIPKYIESVNFIYENGSDIHIEEAEKIIDASNNDTMIRYWHMSKIERIVFQVRRHAIIEKKQKETTNE